MTSTISFSGLSSGIDTSSWIDALVSVKQSTLTSLQSAQVTQQGLLSVVNDIKSFFSSFQGCLQKLTDSKLGVASMDLFLQNLAISSNSSIATATATTDASRQSYDVLVDQLASATKATSGTTTKVATNAALDTTLGTLGATAGTITVNNQSFSISANDTLSNLITKFSNVGVTASYSNSKGTFTVDCSVSDIDDGTTGLKTALKLSDKTVAAASSGTLVYANANTQFSKLGLTAGALTIEGNNYTITKVDDTNYKIAKDGDAATNINTIGDFLSYLTNTVGADSATIDDKGNVLIRGAVLGSVNGGSNILNVLNLNEITDRTVMDSDPITVDVSHVADANTKLSDLGITDAQTLSIAGVSKPNISTDTTLGQIEQLLKNNGVDMTISNTGVISVDTHGNELAGTLIDSLGLKSSDQGSTIQSASHPITLRATSDTLLSDLGVTNAMSYVGYDSNGNSKTATISNTSGLSVGNFITQLKGEGLDASFDSTTGKIKINNGYISGTVADTLGMVQSKTTVTSTATGDTTLAELGATADQTLIVNGGSTVTYNKSTTLNTIMQAIQAAGGTATIKNGAITVTNANLGGTVPTLLGLDANTQGSSMTSGNLSVITNATSTSTSGVNAGVETNISMASTLGDILGTTANQNLIINGVTKTYASTATLGDINSDITSAGGKMVINSDNTLDVDGVTLSGGLVSAFGLTSDSKATNITSNSAIKVGGTDEYATLGTTLADLGATGNSTLSINGAAGLTFGTTKTIGDVFNAITAAGGTAEIKDGVVTVSGVTLTGTVPDLLKLTATNSGTSVTSGNLTYVTSSTSTSTGVLATSTKGQIDWNTTLGEMFGTTGVNYGLNYTAVSNGSNYTLSYNSSTTLSSIRDALAVNGVNMTINDDSSISIDGISSATGTLATALGLDPDKYKTSSASDGVVMVSAGIHNADANTTFDQLAVINNTLSSASSRYYAVYSTAGYRDGSNNNVPTLIQASSNNGSSGASTIGNWLTSVNSALNTANGTTGVNYATINNGVITVTGGYVTGALADALGITSTTVNSGKVMTGSSVSYVESNMSNFIGTAVTMSGTTQGSLTVNSSGYITGTTIATGTTQGSVNVNSSGYITVTTNATGTTQGSVNVVASGYIGNVVNKNGTATQYTYTGNNISYTKQEGSVITTPINSSFETAITNNTGVARIYTYTGGKVSSTQSSIAPDAPSTSDTLSSIYGSGVVGKTVYYDLETTTLIKTANPGIDEPAQAIAMDGDTGSYSDNMTITSSTTLGELLSFINGAGGLTLDATYDSGLETLTFTQGYKKSGSFTETSDLYGTFFDSISSNRISGTSTSNTQVYNVPELLKRTTVVSDITGSTKLASLSFAHQINTPYTFTINKADGSTVNLTFDSSGTNTINDVISALGSNGITATVSNSALTYKSNYDWSASGDLGNYLAGVLSVDQSNVANGYIGTVTQQTGSSAAINYRYNGSAVTYSSMPAVTTVSNPSTLVSSVSSFVSGQSYGIASTADLNKLASLVNSGASTSGVNFVLENNIDMSSVSNFAGIGNSTTAFSGTFYGNGHTISYLKESSSANGIGFFGSTNGATIQDVTISNANVSTTAGTAGILVGSATNTAIVNASSSGTVSGTNGYTGGLVGAAGSGTITGSSSSASVSGGGTMTGGLVGVSSATISKSFASGTVTGIGTSSARLGGFVGQLMGGSITDSYASGNVTGYSQVGGFIGWSNDGSVTRSYATGKATGSSQVGGFAGNDQSRVTFTNVIYNSDTGLSAVGTSGGSGIVGLALASMQSSSTMGIYGYTLVNGWSFVAGSTPRLATTAINMDGTTTMSQLFGDSKSHTLTINKADGSTSNLTFNSSNTINDVISSLNSNGITATVSGGKMSFLSSFQWSPSGDLGTKLEGSSTWSAQEEGGSSYILTGKTVKTQGSATVYADLSTRLADCNIGFATSTSATISITRVGHSTTTNTITGNSTIQDVLYYLPVGSSYDPDTGVLTMSYDTDMYTNVGGTFFSRVPSTFTEADNIDSNTVTESFGPFESSSGSSSVIATADTTIGTLYGDTNTHTFTFLNGGINHSITMYSSDKISDVLSDLNASGVTASFSGGILTMSSISSDLSVGMTSDNAKLMGDFASPSTYKIAAEEAISNTQHVSDVSTFLAGSSYHISSVADLTKLASLVNSGAGTSGVNFILDNDIDLSSVSNFAAIGSGSGSFQGNFYGNGHTISNLKSTSSYAGLFGYTNGASIQDLAITNVTLSGTSGSGALAGYAFNTKINNVYSTGGTIADSSYSGGLVGRMDGGSISKSFSTVNISSTGTYYPIAGGLVGMMSNATATNVYATGNISADGLYSSAGGLVAQVTNSTITNAYATGNVYATAPGQGYSGGLIGRLYSGSFSNVYSAGLATAGTTNVFAGGLVGQVYLSSGSPVGSISFTNTVYNSANSAVDGNSYALSGVTALTATQMKTQSTMEGKGFTSANGWEYISGLTPTLGNVSVVGQTVYVKDISSFTSGSTYHISTVADMNQLASLVNSGKDTTGVNFILDNDIDMSSVSNFAGIGSSNGFSGTFYGNGHSISNVKQTGASEGGLFGTINSAGSVQDLAVTGANISGTAGGGILAAYSAGKISNVYTTGTISAGDYTGGLVGYLDSAGSITNSYSTATVSGGNYTGGLAGLSNGTITKSYAAGTVTGSTNVGGLVGFNPGSINNSYATGTVTGSTNVGGFVGQNIGNITNAYAIGTVSGSSAVGAFAGLNNGTITNGIYNSSLSKPGVASGSSSGAIGLSPSQMQTESTMEGYGFTSANGWSYVAGSTPGFGSTTPKTISTLVTNTYNATSSTTLGDLFGTTGNIALSFNGYSTLNLTMSASNTIQDLVNQINSSNDGMTASFSDGKFSLTSFVQQSSPNSTIFGGTPTVTTSNTTQYVSGVSDFVSGDTYHISTVADLNQLASLVNSGKNTTGVTFVLDNNIDMSSVSNFAGIGNGTNTFKGSFYGNGHTVSNLKMSSSSDNVGFFGRVDSGRIQDLAITNANVSGANYTGILVGSSYDSSTITNVYTTGTVSGSQYVGGVLGSLMLNGTLTNAYSTATVSGSYCTGGLVGILNGTVSKSYATGSVSGNDSVGGLIGAVDDYGSVNNSYSTSNVSGVTNVGGLAGLLSDCAGVIQNSYSIGTVTGTTNVGTFLGNNLGGTITNGIYKEATNLVAGVGSGSSSGVTSLTISQMKNSSTMQGYGFTAANGWNYNSGSLPQLGSESITNTAGGIQYVSGINNFVTGDTYHISTVADLNKLASLVNGGQDTTGVTFILDNNIDMSSAGNFAGIGTSNAFKGNFYGNGHTVSNLTMSSTSDYVGFFGNTSGGLIQDVGLSNVHITGTGSHYVGGLVGHINGTTITNDYVNGGSVIGLERTGGLIGFGENGTITNSYATVSVTSDTWAGGLVGYAGSSSGGGNLTVSKSFATGAVSARIAAGGFIGQIYSGNVSNSYASGNVSNTEKESGGFAGSVTLGSITNCYSVGTVSGVSVNGGFIGTNNNAGITFTNCVYREDTSVASGVGSGSSTGVTSLTIAQMKNSSTMQGYGFTGANGWNYNSGSLPQLGSESITNTAGSTVYVSGINNFVTGDTYHISTVADLNKLASLVNGGQDTAGVTFILDNNIDMSSVSNFAGIGNATTAFKGTFDGNGHTISTLKMSSSSSYVGFFGNTSNATVQDLAITGANITGAADTGILAGVLSGTVSNVYTTGIVVGSNSTGGLAGYVTLGTITNSYSSASVTGSNGVGGLVGYASSGTISKSYATGATTASGNYAGGLVGFSGAAVNNSYATGSVSGSSYVGGLIGDNNGSVTTAYSLGTVSGTSYVGGLLGATIDPVTNCVYNAAVSTIGVGSGSSSGVTRLSITQMSNSSTMQGIGFSTANGWKYSTGKLPTLGNETVTQNAGSTVYVSGINNLVNGDTYHIKTAADLVQLASLVNSGQDTTGVNFVLDNDIDMSSVSNFAGIGNSTTAFKGSFYGNGHTISKVNISNSTGYAGFFGNTDGATIQDVQLSDVTVSTTGTSFAGGLVGKALNTTIVNSNIRNNTKTSSITGNNYVGGLVGSATGGSITNSYSAASVTGHYIVGGLVGVSTATISNSFASGSVSGDNASATRLGGFVGQLNGGSITDSYASGNVTGYSQVGGFIGWSNDGSVTRSYASGKAIGTSEVGGFAGNDQGRVAYNNAIYNTDLNSTSVGTGARTGITGLTLGNMEVQSTMESYGFTSANGWKYAANKTPQLQSVVSTSTINADTTSNLGELGANTNSELTMTIGSSTKTFTAENTVNDVLTWAKSQSDVTDATFNGSKLVVTSKTNPNLSVTGGLADILFNTGSPATTILTTTTNNASSQEKYIPPDVKLTTDTTIARLLHQDLTPGDAQLIIGGDVQAVLTFKATDTVQNVIDTLAGYGITANVDSNGKFTATGNVNFSLAGAIGNTLMEATGNSATGITGYKSDIEQGTKSSTATASTLLSDLGITSGNVYIKNAQDQNIGTIAIDNTLSINQLSDLLSNYGFAASISNGKYTITSDNGTYLADSTSNAISKLGLSTWTDSSSSLKSSTTLSEMGFTDGTTLGIIKDGSTIGPISFSKTDTLQDIIDTLKVYGIDASIDSNGAFKATSSGAFVFTGDLGNYLTSKGSTGTGYITTANGYTSSQPLKDKTDVSNLTEDTKVGELLKTGQGGLLRIIKNNSDVIEVQYGADEKVSNIISDLASVGIKASVDSNGVFTASSSDEFSLGGDVGKALLGSSATVTDKDDGYISKDLGYTKTGTATGSSVLSDIGVNSGKIYVLDSNGKIVTSVGIDNATTIDQTIGLLKPYGLDMSIDSNGKVTVSSEDGYTLSDGTSNLVSKLKLSTWNKTSEKLSTSTTISEMGFKDGADMNLILDGGSTQVLSFSADDTLQDVINGLSAYGITGSVDSNGAFTATSKTHSFVMSSDLGTYLSKGSTGYVTQDTGYKTASTLNASDPNVTETSKTLTYNTNMSLNSTMADLGFAGGAGLKVTLDGNTPYTLSFLATDKVSDVVYALSAYGINATVDGTGKFTAESTDHTFTLSGSLGSYLTTGSAGYDNEDTGYTSAAKTYTTEEQITSSTKLSDLGVATGSLNIVQNGVVSKNTIKVTDSTTVGQLFSAISAYGLTGSIKTDGSGDNYLEISANSNTKLVDGTSDLIDKLDLKNVEQGDYSGKVEYWDNNATSGGLITNDMLLSSFDKNGKKAAGSFIFTTGSGDDSTQHIVNITSDDTVGSLLTKLQNEGVSASLSDGIIHVSNGVDGIAFNGGTSGLTDTVGLVLDDSETYATSTSALTYQGSETASIANYADASTTLNTMNITDGNLSVYVNGVKCTVAVNSSDTFGGLFSKVKSAVLTKTGQTIEVGFLDKDGNIVSNPTNSNNTGVVSFKVADGTKLVVGATNDTTNFATIANFEQESTNQVSGQRSLYKVNTNSVLTQAGLFRDGTVTAGTFKVGDADFTIDSNTTISSLINQINSSDKSYATAYWDTLSGTMVLQSTLTGASLMNIEAGTSNFTDIIGLTKEVNGESSLITDNQVLGKNAVVRINGTTVSATSNTITSDVSKIKGLTINLKGLSAGESTTITVAEDDDGIYQAVSDTVDSYNSLMKELDKQLSSSTDVSNDSIIKLMRNNLKYLMTSSITGSHVYKNLASIGITTGSSTTSSTDTSSAISALSINKDSFMAALSSDSDSVKNLLVGTTSSPGILLQVSNIVDNALNSTGYFSTYTQSINSNINKLSTKISSANTELSDYRAKLEKQFKNMESTVTSLQNAYSNFLNNVSSTSSTSGFGIDMSSSSSSVGISTSAKSSIGLNTSSTPSIGL